MTEYVGGKLRDYGITVQRHHLNCMQELMLIQFICILN